MSEPIWGNDHYREPPPIQEPPGPPEGFGNTVKVLIGLALALALVIGAAYLFVVYFPSLGTLTTPPASVTPTPVVPTPTFAPTPTPSPQPTPSPTPQPSPTPSPTPQPSPSPTPTPTPSPSPSPSPTPGARGFSAPAQPSVPL